MAQQNNDIYRDSDRIGVYGGDPFSGVPINHDIVETVASELGLECDLLARTLREIEQTQDLIEIGILFSGFDPVVVKKDSRGHLYLVADACSYWDVVANRLNLTKKGREAVILSHDKQVKKYCPERFTDVGLGFVVPSPEFPSGVMSRIHILLEQTELTARQATICAVESDGLNESATANLLGLPDGLVRSELSAVDRETRRVRKAANVLDSPSWGLSRLEPEPTSNRWLGLEWSSWTELRNREELLKELPKSPGVYRVRHTDLPGLLYVGESGAEGGLHDRVGHGLAFGFDSDTPPRGSNHDATKPLWRIEDKVGGSVVVSVASPPVAADKRHRRCIEATLVSVCRRETGRTPTVMLNRDLDTDVLTRSHTSGTEPRPTNESHEVPSWRVWQATTDKNWMGHNWTEPRPLSQRDQVGELPNCVYRVWQRQAEVDDWQRVLTGVGMSETPTSRLFNLENKYGSETIFSIAEPTGLSTDDTERAKQFREIRYDLVGAHYLATGRPPTDQY